MTRQMLLAAVLAGAAGALGAGEAAPQMPDAERQAIVKLVEDVVKLGFPDAQGAQFYVGKVVVTQVFDPDKGEPVLPMRYCKTQSTLGGKGKEMTYQFHLGGLHAKLKDGTWILSNLHRLKPADGVSVGTDELTERKAEGAAEAARKEKPFEGGERLKEWFKTLPEKDRPAFLAALPPVVPLLSWFQLSHDDSPLGLILLTRAGIQEAPMIAYAIADMRRMDYWQLGYWDGKPGPFDPTGQYEEIGKLAGEWKKGREIYEAEALSVAFRRALHRYFFHLLKRPQSLVPLEETGAIALATLDPGDPQKIKPRIEALIAGSKIPPKPKDGATLAERLMAWGEMDPDQMTNFRVTQSTQGNSVGMATEFLMPEEAYTPAAADLDALFGLIGDQRPSRWFDYQGPRTVGENALRAIAAILEKNPLAEVNAAGLEPWTEARRTKAVADLQAWWKKNGETVKKNLPKK